jgi:hypothetical protein
MNELLQEVTAPMGWEPYTRTRYLSQMLLLNILLRCQDINKEEETREK